MCMTWKFVTGIIWCAFKNQDLFVKCSNNECNFQLLDGKKACNTHIGLLGYYSSIINKIINKIIINHHPLYVYLIDSRHQWENPLPLAS